MKMFTIEGKYTKALITIDSVEESTLKQIYLMASHPSCTNPIAIMPDCHAGKGCCIGFTMKVSDKVVPNFVGMDVGCGMLTAKTHLSKDDFPTNRLKSIDTEIRKRIPLGMTVNEKFNKKQLRQQFGSLVRENARIANNHFINHFKSMSDEDIEKMIYKYGTEESYFYATLKSVGSGNHFQEAGVSSIDGCVWFTVHTGSRNFGKKVCEHFDNLARNSLTKPDISIFTKQIQQDAKDGKIRPQDIAGLIQKKRDENKFDFDIKMSSYVTGQMLSDYMEGMFLAQTYAQLNRSLIMDEIFDILSSQFNDKVKMLDRIETVHNFISFKDNVIRKGAVASYVGDRIIVPFNMRDGILICEGKSNPDWNFSAPHGAGRVLSRSQAKEKIDMADYKKSMEGIFTTSCNIDTLDESPMAYKDASVIEEAIEPTAKILFKLKPIYNVKAGGE
jgi:tRNA-splicing ligase RtcB